MGKMKIKKLAAFTLMEVTIAMLLAAISITITYTTYHIVSRSYSDYARKQKDLAVFLTVDKLLKKDILEGEKILRLEDGLSIEVEGRLITYVFGDSYLLRDQFSLQTDTFAMPITGVEFSFENLPARDGELLDKIAFATTLDGSVMPMIYRKKYSSMDLFE